MTRKYEVKTTNKVICSFSEMTDGFKVINLDDLGMYSLVGRTYVIINMSINKVYLTYSYYVWKNELAKLYVEDYSRIDICAFRVKRGFNPKLKTSMYIA